MSLGSPEKQNQEMYIYYNKFSSVAQLYRLFSTPWTAAHQASLSTTNSWSLLKLMSIESVMPSNELILCHPLSSGLQSFPAPGSFSKNQFCTSGGQSIGASASASVLPMNSVQFSCSVVSDSLRRHGLQHTRLPCPSPTPGVYSNSCPLSQ